MARPPVMTHPEHPQQPPSSSHPPVGAHAQNQASSAHQPGRSPGVYVRSNQYQPQELDMLWSGSKQFQKEDRSPVVFTAAGLLLGVVITSALFFLFTNKPEIQTGEGGLDVPVISEVDLLDDPAAVSGHMEETVEQPTATSESNPKETQSFLAKILPADAKKDSSLTERVKAEKTTSVSPSPATDAAPVIHVVQPGDTLGTIAGKYYNNSGDRYVARIVRANNLANPDSLYIDQRLVIPQ